MLEDETNPVIEADGSMYSGETRIDPIIKADILAWEQYLRAPSAIRFINHPIFKAFIIKLVKRDRIIRPKVIHEPDTGNTN